MKKILVVFGTRPEVIKLYPVIQALGKDVVTVFTGQHLELANQAMTDLKIQPRWVLGLMEKGQTLTKLMTKLHENLERVYQIEKPDLVIVQGDTTTALVGALQAYYQHIPVAHVEAGLRSGDIYSPFPEEGNRKIISHISTYHFAPTEIAKNNLLWENIKENVHVVGNTGIDTLVEIAKDTISIPKSQVLITLHRRESFGKPIKSILLGILGFLEDNPDWEVVFPVHLNPNVRDIVFATLGNHPRIKLLPPLSYKKMVQTMMDSAFIITDSGGIQEEAPSLNRPVLVARDRTDRPESIDIGAAELVGTSGQTIRDHANHLAKFDGIYQSMINKKNPYGDGHAGERIVEILKSQ